MEAQTTRNEVAAAATGRRAAYGFLALLALAAFLNTTRAGFVWDDHSLVTPAVGPTTAQDVAESLTPRYWTVAYKFKGKAYRPIRSIILYLNYLCWGGDAGGYHLVSALIHAANTLLAYGLMTRLAGSRLTGLLAASLFAVHPVTAESVAYVKNVGGLVATTCFLAAARLFLAYADGSGVHGSRFTVHGSGFHRSAIRNPKSEIQNRVPRHLPYCLSLLIFAVGLLAREEVVMLPFFLCALGWLDRERWPQGRWKSLIPFFVLACAFLVIRASIAGHTEASENVMDGTGAGRAVSVAATLLNYVSLLALPVNLCADRVFDVPLLILAGAGLFAGLAVLAALASRERTWLIGLALGLIVLLPASNIIPLPDRPLAEQRAYLAGVGYATVMACTLRGLARMRMWATFVAVLATLTVARNFAWRENATLAADTVLSAPRLIRPRVGLAVARLDKGNSQGAERELTRVLDAAPDHPEATYLLAVSYDRLGKLPEALSQYQKAVALGVGGVETRCNMGSLYLKMGLCAQAAAEFRSVLSELDAPAGRADARAHARALRVHAHTGLGSALSDLGEPGEAEAHLRAAIDAGAESASLHAALGLMRVKQGKLAEAAEDLAEARKLDPRLWRVHYLDGLLAEADKDWPRARAAYTRALDASPALATVRERLQFVQTQETP